MVQEGWAKASGLVRVIDSHTGGEPTRVIVQGGPDLQSVPPAERPARLRRQYDWLRTSLICEPRGSDVMVGALLGRPADSACAASVVFFNSVGYLQMCGHGAIGVVATLAYLGQIGPGSHRLETPVGPIGAVLQEDGSVVIENVPSYRYRQGVVVEVPGHGPVVGEVAWGGNWFFLVNDPGQVLQVEAIDQLTELAWKIRQALPAQGITGADGAEIDHIELVGPPSDPARADARNFVLCPGGAYDRSPCGTGTSAKLACLAADGKLAPGTPWRQESIIGSLFQGSYRWQGDRVIPTISGRAHVNAELTLVFDPADPFAYGIGAERPAAAAMESSRAQEQASGEITA